MMTNSDKSKKVPMPVGAAQYQGGQAPPMKTVGPKGPNARGPTTMMPKPVERGSMSGPKYAPVKSINWPGGRNGKK